MIRVILNGFSLEEPEGYDSALNLYANMLVNGLYGLSYEIQRVTSSIFLNIERDISSEIDPNQYRPLSCTVLRRSENLGQFDFIDLVNLEDNLWSCTVQFIPSKEAIEKTWKRAQKLYKAPLMVTQTLMITG